LQAFNKAGISLVYSIVAIFRSHGQLHPEPLVATCLIAPLSVEIAKYWLPGIQQENWQ
jgi:hypothetical protein